MHPKRLKYDRSKWGGGRKSQRKRFAKCTVGFGKAMFLNSVSISTPIVVPRNAMLRYAFVSINTVRYFCLENWTTLNVKKQYIHLKSADRFLSYIKELQI